MINNGIQFSDKLEGCYLMLRGKPSENIKFHSITSYGKFLNRSEGKKN